MHDHGPTGESRAADVKAVDRRDGPAATTAQESPGVSVAPLQRTRGTASRHQLMHLQRSVGNAAVVRFVQREDPPAPNNIEKLDELLGKLITPEDKIIELLGAINRSETEKRVVLTGYRNKLAKAFNVKQMKEGLKKLAPVELPVQLDWIEQAAVLVRAMSYDEISQSIKDAPQSERDMLKNNRWRDFLFKVCTDHTIITAVGDLHFDLATQLSWVREKAISLRLGLDELKPLLKSTPPPSAADLAAVGTDAWQPFWTGVCDNKQMAELVDILFPNDLAKKLEWMAAEGSDFDAVRAKITATPDEKQRLAIFDNGKCRSLALSVCTKSQISELVLDLGGDWTKWREWVKAKGAPLRDLGLAAVKRGIYADILKVKFLEWTTADEADTAYRRLVAMGDTDLAGLRLSPMPADVIKDKYGSDAEKVLRALNGEIAREEKRDDRDETLLSGPTTEPFKENKFGGDSRFVLSFWRDRVDVDVGVSLRAVDDRAKELLASASATWSGKITATWNQFELTNAHRTIPMNMKISFAGGPNAVKVHSGPWVWPNLNAGNWYVPDADLVPGQAETNAQAPVHEFGHLIGNQDEYQASAEHFVEYSGFDPSKPGRPASVTEETDSKGRKRYTDTGSIMGNSMGGAVLARHVDHIVRWVNENLRPGEPAFSQRPKAGPTAAPGGGGG
jgi:hypothetical protein